MNFVSKIVVYYLTDNSSLTNVLVEYSANGDEICYYTVGADLVSQEVNGKVFTYLYDGHGTVRALANESGKLTDKYCYDAFGNLISSTGSTANNYRYCGEQFDSTTGLYYLRARYMDTNTGRFISQDTYAGSTADPTSLHKYLYANSNPVMYTDPSGYYADTLVAAAGMAALDVAITFEALRIFHKLTDELMAIVDWRSDFVNQTADDIADLASGAVTSAEANEEARGEAVDEAKSKTKNNKKKKENEKKKERNKSKPAKRVYCNSRKEAYERAKKAGNGREPKLHYNDKYGPHYHPDVPDGYSQTPHQPSFHDHYFFPG